MHQEQMRQVGCSAAADALANIDPDRVEEVKQEFMETAEELWESLAANGMAAALPLNFSRIPQVGLRPPSRILRSQRFCQGSCVP